MRTVPASPRTRSCCGPRRRCRHDRRAGCTPTGAPVTTAVVWVSTAPQPVTLDAGPRGRMVLTRVLAADGRQHVEIRTRITLTNAGEAKARAQLARILTQLDALLGRLIRP